MKMGAQNNTASGASRKIFGLEAGPIIVRTESTLVANEVKIGGIRQFWP